MTLTLLMMSDNGSQIARTTWDWRNVPRIGDSMRFVYGKHPLYRKQLRCVDVVWDNEGDVDVVMQIHVEYEEMQPLFESLAALELEHWS